MRRTIVQDWSECRSPFGSIADLEAGNSTLMALGRRLKDQAIDSSKDDKLTRDTRHLFGCSIICHTGACEAALRKLMTMTQALFHCLIDKNQNATH